MCPPVIPLHVFIAETPPNKFYEFYTTDIYRRHCEVLGLDSALFTCPTHFFSVFVIMAAEVGALLKQSAIAICFFIYI